MKVIFAQGNPGKEYARTRHNVGFFVIDTIAQKHQAEFIKKPRLHAEVAETTINGEKILFVKPTTFYNETGQAARLIANFYKLQPSEDFLVIHDDLALPLGTIRTREKGSDGGNNGVKSLNSHLGLDYRRIRIGVYSPHRDRVHDKDFVLGIFSADEKNALSGITKQVDIFVNDFIEGNLRPTKITV